MLHQDIPLRRGRFGSVQAEQITGYPRSKNGVDIQLSTEKVKIICKLRSRLTPNG